LDEWENGDQFPNTAESFLSTISRSTMGTAGNAVIREVPLVFCFILIVWRLVMERCNFTVLEYDWFNWHHVQYIPS